MRYQQCLIVKSLVKLFSLLFLFSNDCLCLPQRSSDPAVDYEAIPNEMLGMNFAPGQADTVSFVNVNLN